MSKNIVKEFEHNGCQCIVTEDEHGFWGHVVKDGEIVIEHLFPEDTLDEEVNELMASVESMDEVEDTDDGNCHLCGGCPECGSYCTTDCTCYDEPYALEDDDMEDDDIEDDSDD